MRITSFLAGALCGGLVGSVAALLLAPMAGEEFVGSAKNELEHWVTEAKNAASILGHNYPGSAWYMDSYVLLTGEDLSPKEDTSWLREIWNTVF